MNSYSAQTAYQAASTPPGYLKRRHYASALGRYRLAVERSAVARALKCFPRELWILDCPCGTGRWASALSQNASKILMVDVSQAMVDFARDNVNLGQIPSEFRLGNAENLEMESKSLDLVFSFALTKHLPPTVQANVLKEFGRVARKGVICTFAVSGFMSYIRRSQLSKRESYPLSMSVILDYAAEAGLRCLGHQKCSTILGMERLFWFECVADSSLTRTEKMGNDGHSQQ